MVPKLFLSDQTYSNRPEYDFLQVWFNIIDHNMSIKGVKVDFFVPGARIKIRCFKTCYLRRFNICYLRSKIFLNWLVLNRHCPKEPPPPCHLVSTDGCRSGKRRVDETRYGNTPGKNTWRCRQVQIGDEEGAPTVTPLKIIPPVDWREWNDGRGGPNCVRIMGASSWLAATFTSNQHLWIRDLQILDRKDKRFTDSDTTQMKQSNSQLLEFINFQCTFVVIVRRLYQVPNLPLTHSQGKRPTELSPLFLTVTSTASTQK
jgi:hypothetical protein